MPVIKARDATTSKLTIKGSKNNERPNPIEPTSTPIAIPTSGNKYMYLAVVSRLALFVGIIVKKEKMELISLSINPPSQK